MKILLPTDFSDASQNAIEFAIQFFGSGSKYVLLNTYEEPRSAGASMISLREMLNESSKERLDAQLNSIKNLFNLNDSNIEAISEYGNPSEIIPRANTLYETDFVVMGSSGNNPLKNLLLGSTTIGVIDKIKNPLLIVPTNYKFQSPKHVIIAKAPETNNDLPQDTIALFDNFHSNFTELQIESDLPKAVSQNRPEKIEKPIHITETKSVKSSNVENSILAFVQDSDCDLLILFHHNIPWYKRVLNPSISKKIMQKVKIPVMVLSDSM